MIKQVKTQARVSEEFLILSGYLDKFQPGAVVSYQEVARDTGIQMDASGKQKLRRVIRNHRKECSPIRTIGYKLAEPEMVMSILSYRLRRIDTQVKSADKSANLLKDQFFTELKPDQQKGVMFLVAVFGAIRLAADNGKKVYSTQRKSISSVPMLPEAK